MYEMERFYINTSKENKFLKWHNIVNENLPAGKCNLILTTVRQNFKNLNVAEKIFVSWNFL